MAVSIEAIVFIVIGCSCSEGCGFYSHCLTGSFLRLNSPPIMSSLYCAMRNKSVLKLWSIVETSVMSENDGITHTHTHTIRLWLHGLGTPCVVHAFRGVIRSVSKPSCRISGAGTYDTTTGPR